MRPGRRLTWIAAGVLAATAAALALYPWREDAPPRVWLRSDERTDEFVVSDRPGGAPLPGLWEPTNLYICGGPGARITLVHGDVRNGPSVLDVLLRRPYPAATWYTDRGYSPSSIVTERDGASWRLFLRATGAREEAITAAERGLVGRWRHREGVREIDLDLHDDRTANGSDGSSWTWMSAEDGLELLERGAPGIRAATVTLGADRRTYRGRTVGPAMSPSGGVAEVSGARLDARAGPR